MEKEEKVKLLNELKGLHHLFLSPDGAKKFVEPFGIDVNDIVITEETEPRTKNPKGLIGTGEYAEATELTGVDAFSIPQHIADKIGVKLNSPYLGRWRNFDEEINQLIEYISNN